MVLEVDSALPKGIFTNSFPGVFSTTRFMATPSVACRTFPLPTDIQNSCRAQQIPKTRVQLSSKVKICLFSVPLGRPRPRPDGFTTFCFLGGRFSRREGLPRPVTVKSKSLGSVVVSPTFWKYAISSTLERNAFPSELSRKAQTPVTYEAGRLEMLMDVSPFHTEDLMRLLLPFSDEEV